MGFEKATAGKSTDRNHACQKIASLAISNIENAKRDPLKEMFSEEKAKTRATTLGEGVTFDKIEMVNADGTKGARTTYRFKDINTLKIATDDGMKNMSPAGREAAPVGQKSVPIVFSYAAEKLNIKMPDAKPAAAPKAPAAGEFGMPDMNSPEAQAMMKQMFTDMKMSLKGVKMETLKEVTITVK